jgi:hypothetical protein
MSEATCGTSDPDIASLIRATAPIRLSNSLAIASEAKQSRNVTAEMLWIASAFFAH